jgi:hypothetical protein
METHVQSESDSPVTQPWNKGKLTGAKPPLRPKHVWAVRTRLQLLKRFRLLEPIKHWSGTDLMVTAGRIKAEYDGTSYDMRPSEILIDAIGLGAGVYDRCRELGLPVRAINVAEAAATRENCMRLRDELWFKGREWFQNKL